MADVERSRRQAEELALRAHAAARAWADASAADVERVLEAMAAAGTAAAERLGRLAQEETGYGRADHKTVKNRFNAEFLFEKIRHVPTVGVIAEHPDRRFVEIAEPVGVIAGLVPVTNPTSTVLFYAICAVKARNAVVCAPHPRAARCCAETAAVVAEAAVRAGAPRDLVQCMTEVTLEGTDALMRHYRTDLILATGSRQMVLAAYSCGKPTLAVGPGNSPVYFHRSAPDLGEAAAETIASKAFDNGTACASEQAIVVDREIAGQLREELRARGAHFCDAREQAALERLCFPQGAGGPGNTEIVGQHATRLAELAGLRVPPGTRVLVVVPQGVGREHPLSHELLCPILKWYESASLDEGLATCGALLRYGGDGHTAAVRATDAAALARFTRLPAYRIVVNGPTLFGGMGYATALDPSFMLGTGTIGGTISSDNIGPRHLINVKRVALPVRSYREMGIAENGAAPAAAGGPVAHAAVAPGRNGSADIETLVRRAVEEVMARA